MTTRLAVAVLTALLFLPVAAYAATGTNENKRLYEKGLEHYAQGDLPSALASFREVLRRDPSDEPARAAVRRLERESAEKAAVALERASRGTPGPEQMGAFERFLFVTLPRWLDFGKAGGQKTPVTRPVAPRAHPDGPYR